MEMRVAHPTTAEELKQRRRPTPDHKRSWRWLQQNIGTNKSVATLRRIEFMLPGISLDCENEIRASLGMEPLPQEVDTYDPRTHRIVRNAQPRPRKPRKSRGFDAYLVTLFDMERDRRGLTNSEYLEALMGISGT